MNLNTDPTTFIGVNYNADVLENHTVRFNGVLDQTGTKQVGVSYNLNF